MNIQELAKQADAVHDDVVVTPFLRRFAQIIRNQAREEAAAECDGVYYQHLGPEYGEVRYGIAACSSAIRAMKKDQT